MRSHLAIAGTAIVAALLITTPSMARPQDGSGSEELAKLLAGRVAGPAQSCITTQPNSAMQTIDRTAYVFGSGSVIYVNRTRDPNLIDSDNVLIIRKFGTGTQLCSNDIVTTVDRSSQAYSGNVFLGDFIPYRRAK